MALNLTKGFVLCPPCSGTGLTDGLRHEPTVDWKKCRLCGGYGEIPAAVEEEFWACTLRHRLIAQPGRCTWEVSSQWQ